MCDSLGRGLEAVCYLIYPRLVSAPRFFRPTPLVGSGVGGRGYRESQPSPGTPTPRGGDPTYTPGLPCLPAWATAYPLYAGLAYCLWPAVWCGMYVIATASPAGYKGTPAIIAGAPVIAILFECLGPPDSLNLESYGCPCVLANWAFGVAAVEALLQLEDRGGCSFGIALQH